jgi:hypothetical protein
MGFINQRHSWRGLRVDNEFRQKGQWLITAPPKLGKSNNSLAGSWFRTYFIFHNILGSPSHWLIIFLKDGLNHQPVSEYQQIKIPGLGLNVEQTSWSTLIHFARYFECRMNNLNEQVLSKQNGNVNPFDESRVEMIFEGWICWLCGSWFSDFFCTWACMKMGSIPPCYYNVH